MRKALLAASAVEAFYLLMLLGYGPLYLHQAFHAPDFVASLASAGPALATFVGSTLWGHWLRRVGIGRAARIGLVGYLAAGAAALLSPGPFYYIGLVTASTLFSAALAPATLTFLTYEGGEMGRRLADRLKWQSSGWMLGGVLGGYVQTLSVHAFPMMLAVLGLVMVVPMSGLRRRVDAPVLPIEQTTAEKTSMLGLTILLVLPFFLAYSGNEGFFTNFGLYLRGLHVSASWVGWSASISTGLGWALASSIGRWADRFGGRKLLIRVLLGYALMYLVMSLSVSEVVVIIAFSLPLYPLLNIGIQRAVAESLPGEQHGGAMGIINGAAGLATFGGSVIMGTVNNFWGPRNMPWASVALVSVGLALALILYRRRASLWGVA